MQSIVATSLSNWIGNHSGLRRTAAILAVAVVLSALITSPAIAASFAGLGGYISEYLLGQSGDEYYRIGDGVSDSMYLGSAAIATTQAATDASLGATTTATLHRTLVTLNGAPSASVYFVWGYDASSMTNTTTSATVAAPGAYSTTLTGFDPGKTVYFAAAVGTDGTYTGSPSHFVVAGGHGAGYWILWNVLPMIIAVALFITVLVLTHSWVASLIAVAVGVMTILIVRGILPILW